MTSTPRPVLLILAAALALAIPIAWIVGIYLAGFGVPVAARILIGLLMIPAFFAIVLVAVGAIWNLRQRRVMARHVGPSDPPSEDDIADWERMSHVERSPLIRVIGLGHVVDSGGVTVEFLAVEIRELGGALSLRASGHRIAAGFESGPPPWPSASLSDDVGTRYVVLPGGGGGGPDSMQYDLRFAPAPPPDATRLTVAIGEFASSPMPFRATRTADGDVAAPWSVSVEL